MLPTCAVALLRYCTINTQRRPWHDAAQLLNNHAAAAARLQEQFRHMTCQCSRGSNLHSAPLSPRTGPRVPGHQNTQTHPALHNTCSTSVPVGANQHPPAHGSPRKQPSCNHEQQRPSHLSSSSSPPSTTAHGRLAGNTKSIPSGQDPCSKPCTTQLSNLSARPVNAAETLVSKLQMLPCKDVTSSCEVDTSADEGSDSDSEVELVVRQMHRAA